MSNRQRVLSGFWAAWFLLIQLTGSLVAIEIEHVHGGDAEHEHQFASGSTVKSNHAASNHLGHHFHHEDEHHDHSSEPEENGENGQNESVPSSHTHVVILNVDVPASYAEHTAPIFKGSVEVDAYQVDKKQCPKGPSFELLKPPQLV